MPEHSIKNNYTSVSGQEGPHESLQEDKSQPFKWNMAHELVLQLWKLCLAIIE